MNVTQSTYRRIVRHLVNVGILFSDDPEKVVASVVRQFLYGRATRLGR